MKKILSIDIETYSSVDLIKSGVYAYVDSADFTILLFAYAYDEEDTRIVDLACGEEIPDDIVNALSDNSVIKSAFNAAFERICLSKYLGIKLYPESWQCTSVQASILSLPHSLGAVGEVLNIEKKKLKEGSDLIRYFCMPCKASKSNGGRTRNLPVHDKEKWEAFKSYCIRDVDAERQIRNKLKNYPIPESELELYCLDQKINDGGVLVDLELVSKAVECDLMYKQYLTARAYELTGLENPNSVSQVKEIGRAHV